MTSNVDSAIECNKNARELAAEVTQFIVDCINDLPEDKGFNESRFWEILADFVDEHGNGKEVFNPLHPNVMTETEAKAFGQVIIPWGKYKGDMVCDVPTDYWIALTGSRFYRQLLRYVKTDYFQRLGKE